MLNLYDNRQLLGVVLNENFEYYCDVVHNIINFILLLYTHTSDNKIFFDTKNEQDSEPLQSCQLNLI